MQTFSRKLWAAGAVALLLCGLMFAGPVQAEKIELKLNLPQGAQKSLSQDMVFDMSTSAGGQQFKMQMSMGFKIGVKVEEVSDAGLHTMKLTYERIQMKMAGPVSMEYDSAKKDGNAGAQNPAFAMFDAMIGESLTVKVQPNGKTTSVEGLDELVEKMAKKAPGIPAQAMKQQVESMKQSFDQMFGMYPDKPVAVGDTWDANMKMPANPQMEMNMDAKLTLKERGDGVATIGIDAKLSGAGAAKMNGTMKGQIKMAEKTGWTEGGKMTMDMKMSQGGADVTMDGKTTITSEDKSTPAPEED